MSAPSPSPRHPSPERTRRAAARGHRHPCRRRRALLRTWFLAGATLCACQALEQHVHRTDTSAALRLSVQREAETRGTGAPTDLREVETAFKESLLLAASGFIYHPKFMEYDIEGELAVEQRDVRSSGEAVGANRKVDANSTSYNLSATLFKDLPYSLNLYSYRTQTLTRQTFFGTSKADVRATGVNLLVKNWWIPSQLKLERYRYAGSGLNTYRQDRDSARIRGTRIEDFARYEYDVEYADETLGTVSQSYSTFRTSASTMQLFGDERQDRWTNSVRFQQQTGDVQTEDLGFSSQFYKKLTQTLTSSNSLQYSETSAQGFTTETWTLSPGISHQLFASLSSALTARTSQSTFEGGSVGSTGGILELNYVKKTPVGPLRIRQAFDYYIEDQQSTAGLIPIVDELHVYTLGQPIVLDNRLVIPGSVVVTDATGLTLFVEGVDYSVSTQATDTLIDILPGGLINPGDTLLVDYVFAPNADLRYSSASRTTNIGLRIHDAVQLSYGRTTLSQQLLSGIDQGTLEDSTRTTAAVHVTDGGAMLGVEQESLDSVHTPFERITYLASYQTSLTPSISLRLAADRFRTRFRDNEEVENGTTASGNLVFNMDEDLTGILRGEWRTVDYRTDSGTGVSAEVSLAKRFRASELDLIGRYSNNEFDIASDTRRLSLELAFTRRF